ncbi:unnamed protein product [Acanthoscelides obtectus]|uniref:MADF domain-containing protein n=1 Tax=Acanthoscelides obtectus TaxID=200917 RepID=A0A9P0LGV7_ACAOB|nr:unnamed protein product [Acanthoscelides obtectus]CAK1680596.1 hypothetical protein AOBTE_LOCUS32790 [Acanthoscelides obtectus]
MKEDFDSLPDKDRNDIGKMVMKKWANIRDNWMKCHKKLNEEKKSGAGAKKVRKYLFYEELRFLQKLADHRVTFQIFPKMMTSLIPKLSMPKLMLPLR